MSEVAQQLPSVQRGKLDSAVDLVLRPGDFFERLLRRQGAMIPFLAVYVVGIAGAENRIDTRLLLGQIPATVPLLTSWVAFWTTVLIAAFLNGAVIWLLAGWWYRMRLRFSGAMQANKRHARNVMVFSSLIWSVPALAWLVLTTVSYPNYNSAWTAAPLGFTLNLSVLWAMWVSYRGVCRCFDVKVSRARVWFLIIPLSLYALVFFGTVAAGLLAP